MPLSDIAPLKAYEIMWDNMAVNKYRPMPTSLEIQSVTMIGADSGGGRSFGKEREKETLPLSSILTWTGDLSDQARADFHADWQKAVKSHVGTITVLSEGDDVGDEVFQRPRSFGLEWYRNVEAHREAVAKYATAPAPLRLSASWEHLPDPCTPFVDPDQQPRPDTRSDRDKAVTHAIFFGGKRQRFIGLITEL